MAVVVREEFMAVGSWGADVDYTPEMLDLLTVSVDGKRKPRKLHALIRRRSDNALMYPPQVLLTWGGDEKGLRFGGEGPLWWLGAGDVGPRILDREYVSGQEKLSNPSFDLAELYWLRPAENSGWDFDGLLGIATNNAVIVRDDALECDEQFPARPGNAYRVESIDVTGAGRLRTRIIFEGNFDPANLLGNPGFEDGPGAGWSAADNLAILEEGARTGDYAMRIGPIPKPQLIAGWDFSSGWTLGPTFSIVGDALVAGPNPQPQYISDPNFIGGAAGWTPVAPNIGDVEIVNEPSEGFGGWTMRAGPVTQHQVLTNADFGEGHDFWYPSSTDAEPHFVFDPDVGGGTDGNGSMITAGWSTAGRPGPELIKYLRATSGGTGVTPYTVTPGESYRVEAFVKGHPGSDGSSYIAIMIPHPTTPTGDIWIKSSELEAPPSDNNRWNLLTIEFSVPANRTLINVLWEVHNHSLGYWSLDHFTVTRTRGNRARINYDTAIPVVANTEYRFAADARADDALQVGSVRFGVTLTGGGENPMEIAEEQGSTDFMWVRMMRDVRVPTGYTNATPFASAQDIIGAPVWIDLTTFSKVAGNSDVSTHTPFPVVADQRYLLSAEVLAVGATRGTVAVGVTLSGTGVPDQDFEVVHSALDESALKALSMEVRPPEGYDTARPYVRSTDIEGGVFAIGKVKLTKVDNNSDSSTGDAITVTPERTYKWTQRVWFDASLERGNVRLGVRCVRAGSPDETFYSSPMDKGESGGTWQTLTFDFTPPSGFDEIVPIIVGTDTEGGSIYLDDGEIRDTDKSTVVFDSTAASPAGTNSYVEATAPGGAQFVRCAVVAEAGSGAWRIGAVSLKRTDTTLSTGDAIVADLLLDPITGDPLSLDPGDIDCPEVIPYDWRQVNLTARAILDHYCSVVSEPPREHIVEVSDPPALSVKTTVGTDYGPVSVSPVVLVTDDTDVSDMGDNEIDVKDRATHIVVYGAVRQTKSGRDVLITAVGVVPGEVEYDYNNRPIRRDLPITDGTIDHFGYAQAYADDLAFRESEAPLSIDVRMDNIAPDTAAALDIHERPWLRPGDVVYPYHPEAGVESPDFPTTVEGEPVLPRQARVLGVERNHGPAYYVQMRRSDGSTFELEGVIPSEADETVLTIGDRRPPEAGIDPQGHAEGQQYLRDRASRPR